MTNIILIVLFALDFILLGIVYFSLRKQGLRGEDLAELTEERRLLMNLHNEIRNDLDGARKLAKANITEISQLAGEIEQEIKNSGQLIAQSVVGIVTEMSEKLQPTLQDLQEHKNSLEILSRKLDKQKLLLQKTSERAESFTKYLSGQIPADEIFKDLENKKYSDARHLLSQGFTTEQVARELGLNEQQVRLVLEVAGN